MPKTKIGKRVSTILGGAVLCFAAGATLGAPLLGPKGEFKTFLSKLTYDSSRNCYRPSRPYTRANEEGARSAYVDAAKRYLACMRSAAEADVDYASEVIADGYKEASEDFLADMKQGR